MITSGRDCGSAEWIIDQVKIVMATGGTVDLAEIIIDDTCLVYANLILTFVFFLP